MREYAVERIAGLLEGFLQQLERASSDRGEDAIHDLRVSIRRLSESLRLFGQFFPKSKVKKVRRKLKQLMDYAAAVRDRDIALELLAEAGMTEGELSGRMRQERDAAEQDLHDEVRLWKRRGFTAEWPQLLELFTQ